MFFKLALNESDDCGNMTHKSRGKVSKNINLVEHVCAYFFPPGLDSLLIVIALRISLIRKTEMDTWVTGCHVPCVKLLIKLLKNKKKLFP